MRTRVMQAAAVMAVIAAIAASLGFQSPGSSLTVSNSTNCPLPSKGVFAICKQTAGGVAMFTDEGSPYAPLNLTGVPGPQGPAGPAGLTGATGATGAAGATGLAGKNGTNGTNGTPGATGSTGPAGPVGPTGLTGPIGPIGPIGPPGTVAASITCTSMTTNSTGIVLTGCH